MHTEKERDGWRPRGVIGCLTIGFERLPQNLQAAALPVALDLVLWLGPRISIGGLLQRLLRLVTGQGLTDPDMVEQIEEIAFLVEEFGQRFNLLTVLGSTPLLQPPTLLARHAPRAGTPIGAPEVISVTSVLALVPWWAVLTLAGLVLGFLYLNEIAHEASGDRDLFADRAGQGHATNPERHGKPGLIGVRKLGRFMIFACGLLGGAFVVVPLWMTVVALAALLAEPLSILIWIGGAGFLSYVVLHLLLVVPSLLVGGRRLGPAIGESVLLSHMSLSSLLGLVLLSVVIYEGLGHAWALVGSESWAMAIGIVGNSLVATGLTAAAFEFYRDRMTLTRRLAAQEEQRR